MTDRAPHDMDYPRAPGGEFRDNEGPVGLPEMAVLTCKKMSAVYKWRSRFQLPPFDGPIVHGKPTWSRSTFLAWAYVNGKTMDGSRGGPCHEEARSWAEQVPSEMISPAAE